MTARRMATLIACSAVACVAVGAMLAPASVAAAPTVTVAGRAVPIPGFPHTGNILGAGAAVQAEVKISGTEYSGYPWPLVGVTVYLPAGVKLDAEAFPSCPVKVVVEERSPERCPKGSSGGPAGRVDGVVSFGNTRVEEIGEILSFLKPGGGFEFMTYGHSPVSLEIPSTASLTQPEGSGRFGPRFSGAIPLVETVPGAPDASVESISITLGAAIRKHGKAYYYGRVPKHCPAGGFRVKSEFTFAENANLATPVTVTVPFRAPCPPK